jgi:UDP-N-acetylmuramoylalanine--D-glutamate ligase
MAAKNVVLAAMSEGMNLNGQRVLVVGLARSGIAAAQFLAAHGARVTVNDAKPRSELPQAAALEHEGIEVVAGSHPQQLFDNTDLIVVSPGVPVTLTPFRRARAAGVPVIGEVELACRFLRGRLIGITGSNGKTTTTALTGELLARAGFRVLVGGNIGRPLISLAQESTDETITVIELSSFQLETIEQFRPDVAALLNITPDHLDRYDSMDDYAAAKQRIFMNQTRGDVALLNADDVRVAAMSAGMKAEVVYFSRAQELDDGIFVRREQIVSRQGGEEQILLSTSEIGLKGAHNLENVMAALGLGLACGAAPQAMRLAVHDFKGVEHRLEFAGEIEGVSFYNDSKATNVDAAIKSIEAFDGRLIVILGGKDKGGDFRPLVPLIKARAEHVILIGAAAGKIAAAIEGAAPIHRPASLEDAVSLGFALGKPGSIVLLAPACASFDMFDNYEHRGRVFKAAVANLTR